MNNPPDNTPQGLEIHLNYHFNDAGLLLTALTHSSYAHEKKKRHILNNERLEFLGDAILKSVISEYLFTQYPQDSEGTMTKMRAMLISDKTLSEIAHQIELGNNIRLSGNEKRSGGNKRPSILANTMEAIFGALHLDGGYETAARVINQLYCRHYSQIINTGIDTDYKSKLQEIMQQHNQTLPVYELIKEVGPDHDKTFIIQGTIHFKQKNYTAVSRGKTKKVAEQLIAAKLLKKISA